MEIGRRQVVVGVLAWVAVFGLFVALAGPTAFLESATDISRPQLAAMLGVNALGTVCMGLALYTVSRGAGLKLSPVESIFLNTAVNLVNNFTPFGQASGLPAGGVIVSRWTGQSFERSIAALSMKEVVGFTPGLVVFLVGGSYLVLYGRTIPAGIRSLVAIFTVGVAAFVLVSILVYRNPDVARRVIYGAVAALNRGVGFLPWGTKVDEAEIQARVDTFSTSIEKIASNKPVVAVAGTLTTAAVITQGLLLWITLDGVGVTASPVLTVFIVPISLLASALPLPGGSGGVEGAQILLLIPITSGDSTAIITAVTVARGLVYWTPIVVGSFTLTGIKFKTWWLSRR